MIRWTIWISVWVGPRNSNMPSYTEQHSGDPVLFDMYASNNLHAYSMYSVVVYVIAEHFIPVIHSVFCKLHFTLHD